MSTHQLSDEEITLGALAETRRRLTAIEAGWKVERAMSRRLTVKLVAEYGYSILKASKLSGHNRATILTWLAADGVETRK